MTRVKMTAEVAMVTLCLFPKCPIVVAIFVAIIPLAIVNYYDAHRSSVCEDITCRRATYVVVVDGSKCEDDGGGGNGDIATLFTMPDHLGVSSLPFPSSSSGLPSPTMTAYVARRRANTSRFDNLDNFDVGSPGEGPYRRKAMEKHRMRRFTVKSEQGSST
ncbi:hypothetical protein M434DRAFT_15041 [Hypoxylon sp. CO27-5]|nr:hypothetical protein M434DRAFT_15041 [Hypoxylon sp. CO27-5]